MTRIDWSLPENRPGTIFGVRQNFGKSLTDENILEAEPWLFQKPSCAVITHGEPIQIPKGVDNVVAEAEMALIIGVMARDVTEDEAHHCIRGVVCANDVTALDLFRPKLDGGLVLAKGLDGFCPLGADIASFETLERGVALKTLVNGTAQGDGNTRDMTFSARTIIAYVSKWFTLSPGDVILLGTPEACRIVPGDEVEIRAQGIGSLKNKVVRRK